MSATERDRWTDWLVSIGFGIDFSTDKPPPCTADEYAEAWHRADPSESVETMGLVRQGRGRAAVRWHVGKCEQSTPDCTQFPTFATRPSRILT